jgi:rhodanese-related sulfurtransferase
MATTEQINGIRFDRFSPEEVKAKLDAGEIVLIDVRTPAEFAFEHIPGAMLFPMSSFDPDALPGQSEKRIVFHCGSGMRSRRIAERCQAAGIEILAHMEGGFGAWKKAGLPYVTIDPATGGVAHKP